MNRVLDRIPQRKKNRRIYYGYFIVIACFLIMVLVYGSQASFGVFFKPMLNEFGWTRASTAGPFALNMIISGLLSILTGKLSRRFGPRLVVTSGGIILGLGYILMSDVHNLVQLYLFYGVLTAIGASAMYVPLVSTVARWFEKRRGLMSGIGISGLGFGIGIIPAFASQLIISFSWQTSLLILGAVNLILITLFAQILRSGPETNSLSSSGNNEKPRLGHLVSTKEFSFREALKTSQFWMIFIAWLFYGFYFQVGVVHIVPYATDIGMTTLAAATILTTIGLVGTGGRISLGWIGDILGNKTTVFAGFTLTGIAFLGLSISGSIWMLYIFAVIFGLLSGVGILLIPIVAEYFGFKELGAIAGAFVFANNIGGAIGPPLAGAIFDTTSTYLAAFLICAISGVAAGLIIWFLKPVLKTNGQYNLG